jgi:hypothetical protein
MIKTKAHHAGRNDHLDSDETINVKGQERYCAG